MPPDMLQDLQRSVLKSVQRKVLGLSMERSERERDRRRGKSPHRQTQSNNVDQGQNYGEKHSPSTPSWNPYTTRSPNHGEASWNSSSERGRRRGGGGGDHTRGRSRDSRFENDGNGNNKVSSGSNNSGGRMGGQKSFADEGQIRAALRSLPPDIRATLEYERLELRRQQQEHMRLMEHMASSSEYPASSRRSRSPHGNRGISPSFTASQSRRSPPSGSRHSHGRSRSRDRGLGTYDDGSYLSPSSTHNTEEHGDSMEDDQNMFDPFAGNLSPDASQQPSNHASAAANYKRADTDESEDFTALYDPRRLWQQQDHSASPSESDTRGRYERRHNYNTGNSMSKRSRSLDSSRNIDNRNNHHHRSTSRDGRRGGGQIDDDRSRTRSSHSRSRNDRNVDSEDDSRERRTRSRSRGRSQEPSSTQPRRPWGGGPGGGSTMGTTQNRGRSQTPKGKERDSPSIRGSNSQQYHGARSRSPESRKLHNSSSSSSSSSSNFNKWADHKSFFNMYGGRIAGRSQSPSGNRTSYEKFDLSAIESELQMLQSNKWKREESNTTNTNATTNGEKKPADIFSRLSRERLQKSNQPFSRGSSASPTASLKRNESPSPSSRQQGESFKPIMMKSTNDYSNVHDANNAETIASQGSRDGNGNNKADDTDAVGNKDISKGTPSSNDAGLSTQNVGNLNASEVNNVTVNRDRGWGREQELRSLSDAAEWKRMYDWLASINMTKYADALHAGGVAKLSIVELLQREDLERLGIVSKNDINHFLQASKEFSLRTWSFTAQALQGNNTQDSVSSNSFNSPNHRTISDKLVSCFAKGEREQFFHLWQEAVKAMPIETQVFNPHRSPASYNARKAIEFHLQIYFVVYSITHGHNQETIKSRCRAYQKAMEAFANDSMLTQSREFALYAGFALVPHPEKNPAYSVLFLPEWSHELRNRLVYFLKVMSDASTASPSELRSSSFDDIDESLKQISSNGNTSSPHPGLSPSIPSSTPPSIAFESSQSPTPPPQLGNNFCLFHQHSSLLYNYK